jgi:ankyrin repeat protein
VQLLLERGANPSFCNIKNTCSTLEYAFQFFGADVVVSLLDKGADASKSFSKPSLLDYTNDLVLLKKLVLNGAPAVKATIWSRTDADTIAFLVRSGANIDSLNPDTGRTLLLESAKSDNFNLAQQALSFNANVNIQDKDNNSALSYAIARGNLPLVKLLLSNGSNPDVTVDGNRALYIAVYAGREDIFLALAEAGAPINNVYPGSSRYYERSGSAFFHICQNTHFSF